MSYNAKDPQPTSGKLKQFNDSGLLEQVHRGTAVFHEFTKEKPILGAVDIQNHWVVIVANYGCAIMAKFPAAWGSSEPAAATTVELWINTVLNLFTQHKQKLGKFTCEVIAPEVDPGWRNAHWNKIQSMLRAGGLEPRSNSASPQSRMPDSIGHVWLVDDSDNEGSAFQTYFPKLCLEGLHTTMKYYVRGEKGKKPTYIGNM